MGADNNKERLSEMERRLSEALQEGEMEREDPAEGARQRLSRLYEYNIRTEMDPIVAETERYREMAEEVDDRYDEYMKRAGATDNQKENRLPDCRDS